METTAQEEAKLTQDFIDTYKVQKVKVGQEATFLGKGMAPGMPIEIIYSGMPNNYTFALTHVRDERNVRLYYPLNSKEIKISHDSRMGTYFKILNVNPKEICLELIVKKK